MKNSPKTRSGNSALWSFRISLQQVRIINPVFYMNFSLLYFSLLCSKAMTDRDFFCIDFMFWKITVLSLQASADKDSESPDSYVSSLSDRTDRHRTENPDRIRTADRHGAWDTGHDFPENPDKSETRTGHGQCCPPTVESDWLDELIRLHPSMFLVSVSKWVKVGFKSQSWIFDLKG